MDSAASARPDDDEARRRRSTDCIYFLASPLTCKKGSECEYRHSDAARMNPRDCWYWFNGNCTNPKCSFRHPPLDNLLGAPATPRAAQQSAQQVPVPAQAHGSSTIPSGGPGTAKQGVPCYYFQQGMCAKGVKCAFLHVPQAAGNSAPQKVFTSALQPNPQSKNSWTNKPDSSVQQNTASGILDKSKVSTHDVKPTQKQNLTTRIDHSSRIYQKDSSSHAQSGSARHYHQPQHSVKDDIAEHGVEVGEFVREPLAGSGILAGRIDYESEQSFKGNHNSYRRTSGEQHTRMRRTHGSHEPERLYRGSSGETLLSDKRISQREPMDVTASSSDLRHRLLKQRRLSNPISTQAPDRHDAYLEGCQHRRGNEQAAHDGLTRSRLHGRIKLPGEETSFDRLDSRSEREKDRGSRARLSPPKHTDLRGKLHERLKSRSNEDILDNAKSSVKKAIIGEDAGSLNFTGPKSLAELKAKKVLGSSGEDAVSSTASFVGLPHRTSETVASRDSSESVPFEGPKPLSVMLKRKRQATSADSGSRQEEEEEEEEEEDPARVEGESRKLQIPESGPVEVNMEANGEEDEDAFHPEDDMAYDDNFDGKDLEEPQDEDYDYDTADINAVEDAGELEEPQDEGYDYDVADVNVGNAVEDAGKELEEPQDEDYEYDAADINAGNAVEDAGKELEEPQDEDYDYDAAGINAGNAAEDAGKELEEPQDEDYDYDAADINASNAAEDAGKELEEPQDEDYDYDAADINADEDNDYQEYEDDDDLEDNDDFARKVGVMIS